MSIVDGIVGAGIVTGPIKRKLERQFVPGPFGELQPVTSRLVFPEANLSSGSVTTLTYRSRHVVEEDTPFLIFVWVNSAEPYGNQVDTVTYKCAYDHQLASDIAGNSLNSVTPRRIRFGGKETIDVAPNGLAVSDTVFGPFKKGERVFVRTNVTVDTLTKKWPLGMTLNNTFEGTASGDATLTANSSLPFSSAGVGVSPVMILGAVNNRPSVAGIGDSILDGSGDVGITGENNANNGFLARACYNNFGLIKFGEPGRRASNVAPRQGYLYRGDLTMQAKNIVCSYGTNDISGGDGLTTVQANLIAIWGFYANTGRYVFQCTIAPRTTSTDSWATATNQTVVTGETTRQDLNTWLRAGAPTVAGAAVAVGTSGALVAGDSGHLLTGVFDIAAPVEVNSSNVVTLNGGRWITTGAANYPTTDGTHPTRATSILMAAQIDTTQFSS